MAHQVRKSGHGPLAELGGQLLEGEKQELFLGAEVVLDQPQGHAGLGRDLAHAGCVQAARGGRPQQRVLLVTGARSALLTPARARARGSLMPQAEVAIVGGSHGGFDRVRELNDRIAAFIKAQATAGEPRAGGRA